MTRVRVDLSGQSAVITGSTSGIGAALAEGLAANGCDIVLNGLGDAHEIEALRARLADTYKIRALYHPANMLHAHEIADLIGFAHRELGRLDILVNNPASSMWPGSRTSPPTSGTRSWRSI